MTLTKKLAASTAYRVKSAAHVAGDAAAHGTPAELEALAAAVLLLEKAEKLLTAVAEGKAVKSTALLKLAAHGYGKAA